MDLRDQADESRRLEELYAQMSDEELVALAENVADLTDIAQRTLKAEIAKRGPKLQVSAPAIEGFARIHDDLVEVWRARSSSEAHSVKQILDYAGIASCLIPSEVDDADSPGKDPDHEAEIKVMGRDVQRARNAIYPHYSELYAAYPGAAPKPEEEADYVARCPKCGSRDVVFQSLNAEGDRGHMADPKFNWTCDGCGHEWQDEGNEEKY